MAFEIGKTYKTRDGRIEGIYIGPAVSRLNSIVSIGFVVTSPNHARGETSLFFRAEDGTHTSNAPDLDFIDPDAPVVKTLRRHLYVGGASGNSYIYDQPVSTSVPVDITVEIVGTIATITDIKMVRDAT